jgi:hypothetical protein
MLEVARTLGALREGIALISDRQEKPSIFSRLRRDMDVLLSGCTELWDSVGEYEEYDDCEELASWRTSGRSYEIRRIEWGDDHPSTYHRHASDPSRTVSTRETAPYAGSTLAASLSTSISSVLPTVVIGTQSLVTTLVHAGTQVAIPVYAMSEGQLVLDHYTILTAPDSITGWAPQMITTAPVSTIPMYAATFAVAHALDSIHSYVNNRCSARAAITNVLSGTTAGAIVGSAYYGAVTVFGMAHAPLISTGLCLSWLVANFWRHRERSNATDLAVGGIANLAGLTCFLVSGSAWLSVISALAGSLVSSSALSWLSKKWSDRLRDRLCESACEILGVARDSSRIEIESAFRQLARTYHPDKQGNRNYFELLCVSKEILLLRAETEEKGNEKISNFSFMDIIGSVGHSFLSVATTMPAREIKQAPLELPSDYLDSPD